MERILLIVDDMPSVGRSMGRYLRAAFDKVVLADSAEQAELLLADPSAPPTHLVTDQFLGPDQRLGTDLVAVWRRQYPHLRVAVLMTAAEDPGIEPGRGVDVVIRKPVDVRALRDSLLAIPAE